MTCSGRCTITRSEARNRRVTGGTKNPDGCPDIREDDANRLVDAYLAPILQDAEDGCPDCDCEELPDQDPKWAGWRAYTGTVPFERRVGNTLCRYTINFRVEIRKRVFDGICYDRTLPASIIQEHAGETILVCRDSVELGAFIGSTPQEPLKFTKGGKKRR